MLKDDLSFPQSDWCISILSSIFHGDECGGMEAKKEMKKKGRQLFYNLLLIQEQVIRWLVNFEK